jgi:hypothetical protein
MKMADFFLAVKRKHHIFIAISHRQPCEWFDLPARILRTRGPVGVKKQADFKEVEEENERTSKRTRNRQKKNEFVATTGTWGETLGEQD